MHTRFWIVVGLAVIVLTVVGSHFYELDVPLWWYFAGKRSAIDPLTLHLEGEFVESDLGVAQEPN